MGHMIEFPDNNDVVILELDKPRELRLGHKAMKRYSALTGTSLAGMQDDVQRYDNMCTLLFVMLSQDDPNLTREALDDMIDHAERRKENRLRLADVITAVSAAVAAAFGTEEDREAGQEEDPPQAAGTGERA